MSSVRHDVQASGTRPTWGPRHRPIGPIAYWLCVAAATVLALIHAI